MYSYKLRTETLTEKQSPLTAATAFHTDFE